MKKLIPRKQYTKFGYLSTCITMIIEVATQKNLHSVEHEVMLSKKAFTTNNTLEESSMVDYLVEHDLKVKVISDDFKFQEEITNKYNVDTSVKRLTVEDIDSLIDEEYIVTVSINALELGIYSSEIHYVTIYESKENHFVIVDPRTGRSIEFSKKRFSNALKRVESQLHLKPIVLGAKK